jgi:putative ABC transport system substrate-binding protein
LSKQGAVLALARDYHDMGRDAGELAARVIRGESPANIPLKQSTRSKLVINLDAAKSLGLTIPSDLIKAADDVVGVE